MATINVKDSGGAVVAIEKPLAPSRVAAALSRPVVLSTEDKTALDLLHTDLSAATPAGANIIGKIAIDQSTPGVTDHVTASPATDQDPIFDHTNGTKSSVTVSATIITPPAGCKFIRISADTDVFVNTAGNTAVDDGTSIRII